MMSALIHSGILFAVYLVNFDGIYKVKIIFSPLSIQVSDYLNDGVPYQNDDLSLKSSSITSSN